MRTWTATAVALGPVALDVEYRAREVRPLGDPPSDASPQGESSPVSGRLAGQRVGFDVEVHAADEHGLAPGLSPSMSTTEAGRFALWAILPATRARRASRRQPREPC
jgi:hypothetical protein